MPEIKQANNFLLEDNQYMELSTAEVIVYNPNTQVELFSNSLKSDKLDQKVDEVKIKAGIYNNTFAVIDKNKEITFEMVDVLARYDWSLQKWGAEMQTGKVEATHFPKAYTVTLSGVNKIITLDKIPLYPEEVSIYHTSTQKLLVKDTDFTISGKVVTITDVTINDGDSMWVTSFKYTSETLKYYDIKGTSLPSVVSLVVRKPVYNLDDEIVFFKVMTFPKVKMSHSLTEEGATEKDEKTRTTTFTVLQSQDKNYLGRVYLEPYHEEEVVVTPITDLTATSATTTKSDLTFTPCVDATMVELEYKISTDSNWSSVNIGGTSGVRIPSILNEYSTGVTVSGLTSASNYSFRLNVIDGLHEGVSNVATVTVA